MNSIKEARKKKKLSISQWQAVIKLLEKKDWRPISPPNVDYTIMLKALATRFKETLPNLKSCQQTVYVKNRFIREGARLVSNILENNNIFNWEGYIVTVDI